MFLLLYSYLCFLHFLFFVFFSVFLYQTYAIRRLLLGYFQLRILRKDDVARTTLVAAGRRRSQVGPAAGWSPMAAIGWPLLGNSFIQFTEFEISCTTFSRPHQRPPAGVSGNWCQVSPFRPSEYAAGDRCSTATRAPQQFDDLMLYPASS